MCVNSIQFKLEALVVPLLWYGKYLIRRLFCILGFVVLRGCDIAMRRNAKFSLERLF